jgi:hypothetical protein
VEGFEGLEFVVVFVVVVMGIFVLVVVWFSFARCLLRAEVCVLVLVVVVVLFVDLGSLAQHLSRYRHRKERPGYAKGASSNCLQVCGQPTLVLS